MEPVITEPHIGLEWYFFSNSVVAIGTALKEVCRLLDGGTVTIKVRGTAELPEFVVNAVGPKEKIDQLKQWIEVMFPVRRGRDLMMRVEV